MVAYSDIRDVMKKETDSAAIVRLDEHFYPQLKELLIKKKEEALKSSTLLSVKEYENIKRIALSIYSKREEKLLLMALRGEGNTNGLSENEVTLLEQVKELIKKSRASFSEIMDDSSNSSPHARRIRIVNNVEQYTGLDKRVYGPFKSGEEQVLPDDEADWLLKAKMAELIR